MNSDWDILESARKGDEVSWRKIVEGHNPHLVKIAFLITGSIETANDLTQETFIKIFRKKEKHHDGSLKAYLSKILYHLALKEKKRFGKFIELDSEAEAVNPSSLDEIIGEEKDRFLALAINSLDARQRETLVLRFYGGHSYDEIAKITDVPIGTVKSRIFNAVNNCRKDLRKKGILE
ncbi:MAG: RNA polymerase sigma factor [Candidatus Electryonea clarkiae]|nr:RNA polymerase sigma factor [Candidatus Electryonea clarkiae]MDP8285901.1 RNA polymerase sigma factor [Candidatus Electryonea clarkiae]